MIKVKLTNWPAKKPIEAISHAAKTCYEGKIPKWGGTIDTKGRLFDTGHHTTFQHTNHTFTIDNISIGDITLGLHLANPFYNSSQRSGRFCAGMFAKPNIKFLAKYINHYWPGSAKKDVIDYISAASTLYQKNIEVATEKAVGIIKEERPFANEKYIQQNAPKIAQEQLRVVVPLIFPTGITYTVNTSALSALYRSAWSPVLLDLTQKMADLVLKKDPRLEFAFDRGESNASSVKLPSSFSGFFKKPLLRLKSSGDSSFFVKPTAEELHPIDLLHFTSRLMNNNVEEIKTEVELSLATMGQDQRHRTVKRSSPSFTGGFYLPPIVSLLEIEKEVEVLFEKWLSFQEKGIDQDLISLLAPYGAMVKYSKSASYNAAIHELHKRLCWCAQEEIYHLTLSLREQLGDHPITEMMAPNCALTGRCGEGTRFCGRDLKNRNHFPQRKV